MKNSFFPLFKVQMLNFWGIGKMLHSKDRRSRTGAVMAAVGVVLLALYIASMLVFLSHELISAGMGDAIIPLSFLICNIVVLIFTFFRGNLILKLRDFDILFSLPLKVETIIASKISTVYLQNLLITFALVAPGAVYYGVKTGAPGLYYLMLSLSLFLVQAVPLVVAFLVSYAFGVLSAGFKYKKAFATIFNFVFLILIFVFIFSFNSTDFDQSGVETAAMQTIGDISGVYPVAAYYAAFLRNCDIVGFVVFMLGSVVLMLLFLKLLKHRFIKIHERLNSGTHTRRYNLSASKEKPILFAMLRNEFKRYSNYTTYIVNTGFGALIIVAVGVALLFLTPVDALKGMGMGYKEILSNPEIEAKISSLMFALVPLFIGLCGMISPSTTASVSIERDTFWISKSLPVESRTVFSSKLLVHIVLFVPAVIISSTLICFSHSLSLADGALMFAVPLVSICFGAVVGLFFNLKHTNFDWENETEIVKRGMAVFSTMICTILIVAASVIMIFILGTQYCRFVLLLYCLGLATASVVIFKKLSAIPLKSIE